MLNASEQLFADSRQRLGISPRKPLEPIPLTRVQPQAGHPIVPFLSSRYGLTDVPDFLAALAEQGHNQLCPANMSRINVGMATCGQAAGAGIRSALLSARPDFRNKVLVRNVGCLGACYAEPLMDVRTPEGLHYIFGEAGDTYAHWSIIHTALEHSLQRKTWLVMREREPGVFTSLADLETVTVFNQEFADFLTKQHRRISGSCGCIDPDSLSEYAGVGGYWAFAKALLKLSPAQVIAEVSAAGLRGRGGGGFMTGRKWEIAASSHDPQRMILANADEGDPGAYMDRDLLESDPHRVLEGVMLAAYAIGARQAHIFVRQEYPLAVERLRRAIAANLQAGLLGEKILGTDFSLQVGVTQGAGAFVCGEEMAMIQVMQGQRGEPLPRPPYPAQEGLFGHPTLINNVETLANVPWILAHGAPAFRGIGPPESPGTKIFCLTGDIPHTGFIEVPLGIGMRTVVEQIGGASAGTVKALQIGGPSGGILPYADLALDYDTVAASGAMIGSGGLVALDFTHCVVDLAHHLTSFMADESCGQCLYCRDGLALLRRKLYQLTTRTGTPDALALFQELGTAISRLSLCGLGKSAVNPLLTTLRYFREEYEAHLHGMCPAASCKALIHMEIIKSRCTDCLGCHRACPVHAISLGPGQGPERYIFDHHRCIRCRTCMQICPHSCILAVSGGE